MYKRQPALMVKTLVPLLAVRMGAPSLVEAAESMISGAPEAKDGAEGTVMVLVGSAGEPPPYPPARDARGGACSYIHSGCDGCVHSAPPSRVLRERWS